MDTNIGSCGEGLSDPSAEFADIAPYNDTNFHEKLELLLHEPGFEHAVRYVMPDVDFPKFCAELLSVKSQSEFQQRVMGSFLQRLESATTKGVTIDGIENIEDGKSYTFLSNHRDIVLDASFLNLSLLRVGKPLTQVAIGNNLLIYEWITDLVKLNRSFIVKRDVKRLEALQAARKLSAYIHYTINHTHESVWIAQREGRAKDSNDKTQEALLKMLSLGGNSTLCQGLMDIHILPVSISYEYDPNDFLKVREFLLRRRDPEFKKSQRDDLYSMETGLLGQKGRVHFQIGKCVDSEIAALAGTGDNNTTVKAICRVIDTAIYTGYHFYPINYIAYDMLEGTDRFADKYTADDVRATEEYFMQRLAMVDVDDITDGEREFMRLTMLGMYANTLRNYLNIPTLA